MALAPVRQRVGGAARGADFWRIAAIFCPDSAGPLPVPTGRGPVPAGRGSRPAGHGSRGAVRFAVCSGGGARPV